MPSNFSVLTERTLVGNKAYNLTIMNIEGFPIPPGFVIAENENLNELAINDLYIEFIKKGTVSVRSSSNNEDTDELSNAGLYKTLLDVDIKNIIPAIDDVSRSAKDKKKNTSNCAGIY